MQFANEEERTAMIVSINSIIGNVLLSLGKLAAGFLAGSSAMISDGIHSSSDVISTLVVMAGVKFSHKASDAEHQYGHERMECVAAILLSAMLAVVALFIGYSGYEKAFGNTEELIIPGQMALWAAVISMVVKEAMFWYTKAAAEKVNSGALMADAWHHRSDALSSVGSFIGILGARMGYPILDPIASIVICFMILQAAYEIFMDATEKMVDRSCDSETEAAIRNLILRVPGVDHLDHLYTRMFGSRIYVDVEISVDDKISIVEAHHIAEMLHAAIEANFPLVKHCMVHVNPISEETHDEAIVLPPELLPPEGKNKP
ncbi:MAG: cation diffusion facilitator family transporter [Acidaminococcaceae bacterium]|nr:cation diffusion facilitator family transporter [Acidaminococcaceae bacterium]